MSRLKHWRRILILSLCMALMPLGAFGLAASSPFSDVPTSHWSLAHVTKMELRGIITGYGNNIFKPENTVTQLEATAMAIRAMGLKEEADRLQANHLNSTYQLPTSWNAAGYVSLALEKGLIDADNFKQNQGASRAWVAQLIIRMIGAEQEAQSQSASTTFIDDFAIASNYKKYVSLAAQKEIITGIRNNSGAYEFRPNNLVKRAELAAMISRSDRYMADVPGQLPTATVQAVNGQQLEIVKQDGSTAKHFTTSSTHLFDANAQQILTSSVKENDLIRYAVNQAGVFTFIEVLNKAHYQNLPTAPTAPQQSMLKGIVEQHLRDANLLIINDEDGKLKTYSYTSNVAVKDRASNQALAITDIVEGDEVYLRLLNGVIVEMQLEAKSTSGFSKGTIFALDLDRGILTLEQNGRYSAFALSNQVVVEYEGTRFASVRDLQVGDEVELTVENQRVELIKLVKAYQRETATGKIVALSTTDRIVTIRTQTDGLKAYDLPIDAEITIQGVHNPTINDLLVDDNVHYTVENNQLKTIEVRNRIYQNEVKGEVISIDDDRRLLTIEDEQKELRIFKIDDYVFLDLDRRDPTLYDVKVGMRVTLTLDKNVIKEIATTNKIEGTIEMVDDNRNYMTINDGNRRTNYMLSSDVNISMADVTRPRIRDLKEGQVVVLQLKENEVTDIKVKEERHTQITRVRADYDRIEVREGRSSTKEYRIYSDTKITIPGISRATIDDLEKDDIITLKFVGSDLKEIIVIPPYYGHITSVDGSRVVVQSGAQTETIRVNSSLIVHNSSGNEMSASGLKVHDYVRVIKAGDKYTLTQASATEGELYSVSTSQGKIYFYDSNKAYRNLDLGRDVVAWSGTGDYLIGDLERGMKITMYLFDNKVVGIRVK